MAHSSKKVNLDTLHQQNLPCNHSVSYIFYSLYKHRLLASTNLCDLFLFFCLLNQIHLVLNSNIKIKLSLYL